MQYSPGEYIALSRQLEDPNDLTTRFVRAYVRKKKGTGDVLLATLDMEDQSGQRFTYAYQCPQDSDFYTLNVVIKVFDDSSYLVESNRYERREQDYEIAERWGKQFGGFTGPGSDIDYGRLRKIVKEEVKNTPKTEIKEVDLKPLMRSLEDVNRNIKNIDIPEVKFPEQDKVNLKPVVDAIEEVKRSVTMIDIPEPEKLNLDPVLSELDTIKSELEKANYKKVLEAIEKIKEEIRKGTVSNIKKKFEKMFAETETGIEEEKEPIKPKRIFR